jgi:hypothetical protein
MVTHGHRSKQQTGLLPIAGPSPLRKEKGISQRKALNSSTTGDLGATVGLTTIRLYYDAAVAVAVTTVFAIVVALIAAVIVGSNAPMFPSRSSFLRHWSNPTSSLAA